MFRRLDTLFRAMPQVAFFGKVPQETAALAFWVLFSRLMARGRVVYVAILSARGCRHSCCTDMCVARFTGGWYCLETPFNRSTIGPPLQDTAPEAFCSPVDPCQYVTKRKNSHIDSKKTVICEQLGLASR
jgi:hypothetical protein